MCEQSSINYSHGDVVWCKLGPCWWPGEIHDLDRLPPEVLAGLKKPPFAAVKFFQEDKYEYVRNLDHIYHYNCRRKNEFIKKGLDMHRASVKHMDKFPIDVCTAEKMTNGDPDIITSAEFGPNKKVNYSSLFGTPVNKKLAGRSSLSGNRTPKRGRNSMSPRSTPKSPMKSTTPRSSYVSDQHTPSTSQFTCQFCNFVTGRLNIIVVHNKLHFSGELPIKDKKTKGTAKGSASGKKRVCKMVPSKTNSIDEDLLLISQGVNLATYTGSISSAAETSEDNRKRKGGKSEVKFSKKQKTVDIRENLLADWADDSDTEVDLSTVTASVTGITEIDKNDIKSVEDKKEVKENPEETKRKSCFDFEDEEEEATIISKSPGRKIPRVIPEHQRNKSVDYSFTDIPVKIISKDNLSEDLHAEEKSNENDLETIIEKKSEKEPIDVKEKETTDANEKDVFDTKEKESHKDDSKEDEDNMQLKVIEEEFVNIMEQTSLPDLPSIDSLKKFKRSRSKSKSTERVLRSSIKDEVGNEPKDDIKEVETSEKSPVNDESEEKFNIGNGSLKNEIYENNKFDIVKTKTSLKNKLISVDDLNGRERIRVPDYSILDENLLENNDSEKENDVADIAFGDKIEGFSKEDSAKNIEKTTEDVKTTVAEVSIESSSENDSLKPEEKTTNNARMANIEQLSEESIFVEDKSGSEECEKKEDFDVEHEEKIKETEKSIEEENKIDGRDDDDSIKLNEKSEQANEKIFFEENKETIEKEKETDVTISKNEEEMNKENELISGDKINENLKTTNIEDEIISNDTSSIDLKSDILDESVKTEENKQCDNENSEVYINKINEDPKNNKESLEDSEIIPDSDLNLDGIGAKMAENEKETIIEETKSQETEIKDTTHELISEPNDSLTYPEESEFDSIENEIQRITSADSSPCKTNSFPENIATITTPVLVENKISEDIDNSSVQKVENLVEVKGGKSDGSLESEIAKLTHTKLDESEITPTSKYSTSSSKLLEILTESKVSSEKTKLNMDEYSLVEIPEPPRKAFPTAAAKKHGIIGDTKLDSKTTKFVIKSTMASKDSSQKKSCKPIILSEEIIKPADDAKKVSVQKVTSKRSYEDIEDIDTFIIKKPLRTSYTEDASTRKSIESIPEPTRRTQKLIKLASEKHIIDESMFDINSMPIVLSDDLSPESIQNMPIVLSNVPEKELSLEDKIDRPVMRTIEKAKSPVKQTSVRSVVQQGLSKNQKVYQTGSTKLLQNKPAVITQPGKPGKFIILGPSSSSSSSGSKYTVGKRTKIITANQSSVVVNKGSPDVSSVDAEQKVGNKVMLLTNSQGQHSRIILSPAQQKLLSSKIGGSNVIAKGSTAIRPKGKILSTHSIVTSKSNVVSLGPAGSKLQPITQQTVVTSKGQLLMPVHSQSIITSKGQILTPVHTDRVKSIKTVAQGGKRIQLQQKILLPTTPVKSKQSSAEIKPNTVVVRGKQAIKKMQPNILSSSPTTEQIISRPTITIGTPTIPKAKIIQSPRTMQQTPTKQILRGSPHKIVLQKVPSTNESVRQHKLLSKIQKGPTMKTDTRSTPNSVGVPPLVPLSPKTTEPNMMSTVSQIAPAGLAESNVVVAESKSTERQLLKQIILQDEMGNQTTVTQGQILAVPGGDSVDGQSQSYVLVTVDESGNLLPLDNQALMALDPNIVGQDGNVVLQFNQSAPRDQKIGDESAMDASSDVRINTQQMSIIEDQRGTTSTETSSHDLMLSGDTGQAQLDRISVADAVPETQNVTYSISNPGSNQQIIISGDSENAQQLLNALASGNQDLSKLISGAEGNFIIDADGQQILLDTSGGEQIILTAPGDGLQLQENYCTDFVTQVTTNQDILAEALANTDVFQQDHAIGDNVSVVASRTTGSLISGASRLSPSLYQSMQLPNLAPSAVLETSLTTLGPPIMSPLEVPSNGNSKKLSTDLGVESDLGTQIPKSLQLPITITDPNISQTVSQQNQLSGDLSKSLSLPITITDPNISSVGMTDLTGSAFNYSLPTLDDSPDFNIDNTPSTISKSGNKGPISMPLLTDDSESPADEMTNRNINERVVPDGLGEIFDESRETRPVEDKINDASTALDVLANVTTTSGIIDTRPSIEPDGAGQEIDESPLNESEIDAARPETNESCRSIQERFVLESPENEIDSNSDEIALQPPIVGETGTDLDSRITDVDESFSECVLENGETIKKTSFDDVS